MAKVHKTNSKIDGFRMPGEHEAQEAVWMAWPERTDSWQWGAKPAQTAFVAVATAIAAETPVTMAVSYRQYANARALLPPHIRVIEMTTNDSWMRDMGPSYVINGEGERRGISWQFNAWGGFVDGLYFPWDADDAVAQKVCEFHGDDSYQAPLILEGGSIHVDGEGTVYTTEECLLHPSRNPDLTREEIEEHLINYLNVSKVIWLPRGLYNDVDTNGHIDNLIHIPRPGEVVLSWCDDPADPQYEISREALTVLLNETDAKGRSIKVHKIPVPDPMYIREDEATGFDACEGMDRAPGVRLAGSYANFLISNRRIIFPLLCKNRDEEAKAALGDIFPEHEIVGVDARDILLGGGNIHCITQQIPMI